MDLQIIKEKYPDVEIEITYDCAKYCEKEYGIIILNKIIVPKEKRKQGIGSDILKMLCEYVDEVGSILMLTPSTSLGGTSITRLKRFYSKFGLVSNSKTKKIVQLPLYGMYRFPVKD